MIKRFYCVESILISCSTIFPHISTGYLSWSRGWQTFCLFPTFRRPLFRTRAAALHVVVLFFRHSGGDAV